MPFFAARRQTAQRNGHPIPLTTKEYALLEFLARNAGRVVGRAAIFHHVWDARYDPCSNLIESCMNRLRRKLESAGAPKLIQARRGAGYVSSDSVAGD